MANIAAVLKDEISRLSRREIRKEVQPIRKASAVYRREIAALKRQVQDLRRQAGVLAKRAASAGDASPSATATEKPMRFVAKGLRSLRTRLGLSASDLAKLLGVSDQSVYNWELKRASPRKEQMVAIASMRTLGKREAHARLEALRSTRPRRAPAKARKK